MSNTPTLETALYSQEVTNWPEDGNHILAQFDEDSIVVYQAYKPKIASAIVASQNFHSPECISAGFSMQRMTWVKTNYLWMMYRSGWASKRDQERVLAITISRDGFEEILRLAGESSTSNQKDLDQVRLQWDPDHNLDYSKVSTGRRAIQLGLRNEILSKFSKEFIRSVTDITDFVVNNRQKVPNPSELFVPVERVYTPRNSETAAKIKITRISE